MKTMMVIALKYGLPGLITIASDYGVPAAVMAFFLFYPPGVFNNPPHRLRTFEDPRVHCALYLH
jgi:hypothetical protein